MDKKSTGRNLSIFGGVGETLSTKDKSFADTHAGTETVHRTLYFASQLPFSSLYLITNKNKKERTPNGGIPLYLAE